MFSKTNRTKKSFIGAIAMSLVLLMGSAFGFLLETNLGQITQPTAGLWTSYTTKPSGSGTSETSPYKITTPQELAYLIDNLGAGSWYIELASNIDLGGHEWVPIKTTAENTVTFKGNGHTISNMKIKKPEKDGVGFFEGNYMSSSGTRVYTTLKFFDTNFSNIDIYSYRCTGTVIAEMKEQSIIQNVNVLSGKIYQSGEDFVGGIIGYSYGKIINCTNNAALYNNNRVVGGIAGSNIGTIENCVNAGDIYCARDFVGGIVGQNVGLIKNCYAECNITAASYIGGIASYSASNDKKATNIIENSGFNGVITVEGESPTGVGSMVGYGHKSDTTCTVKNCFGVVDIYLKDTTNRSFLFSFGACTDNVIENCYSYSHVYTTDGEFDYRKYKGDNFDGFAYDQHINGGYPFPRSLFAVGQFIESDTLNYLQGYGFSKTYYDIRNDGTHYYVELGQYPQTYVGDSLNTELKSWYSSTLPTRVESYTNDLGTSSGWETVYVYRYKGNNYARYESANTNASGYKFQNGTTVVNGSEYWFKVEPIKWWVLNYNDVKNSNANPIVLAEKGLTANVTWNKSISSGILWSGTCNIRTWLNNQFYGNSFYGEAQNCIKQTTVLNNTSSSLVDGSGSSTNDKVWLLSYEEADKYFTQAERMCKVTDYAIVNKVTQAYAPYASWWLRSAHSSSPYVRGNDYPGHITFYDVSDTRHAVRPALTLNI